MNNFDKVAFDNNIFKRIENWKYIIENHPFIEGHTLKVWEKEIPIVPWVVSVNALLDYFWINSCFKNLKASFSWILKLGDEVNFKKEWDRYLLLKDNSEVVSLEEIDSKEDGWAYKSFLESINSQYIENISSILEEEWDTVLEKELFKNISEETYFSNSEAKWTIFQWWKFKLHSDNINYYYKKEWKISEGDMFLWAYKFDPKNPSIFLLEMVAQTGSKAVANILDPENSEKWKILTLKDFEFQLLKEVEKSKKLTIVWKIKNLWKRDITIVFDIIDWDWNKVAIWVISWNIVMKKILAR